jgi:hypothetical protein
MKKSKKVQDREMFKAANERLTSDVDSIIKDIKSMEPITAMKEANSVIARKGKYKNLTQEQSKKILQDTEDHIFERDIPEDPEGFAKGGRIGFKGGADMGTVADSKGQRSARSVSVSPSGSVTTSRTRGPDGPDDRGSPTQNLTQYLVNQGVPPKEIRRITGVDKPSAIDRVRNSPYNNPITRGILRAGAYTLNPSLAGIDFRKAMQLKNAYDVVTDEFNKPVSEEDLTLGVVNKLGKTFFPEGDLQNIKSTSPTQKDYNIRATKDMVENLPGGIVKDILAPAGALVMSPFYDAIQATQRMKPGSGIAGFAKAFDAENPLSSAVERFVGASAPLAERFEDGGRAGFMAGGMGRRGFLKLLAGSKHYG